MFPDETTHHYDFGMSGAVALGENVAWMKTLDVNGHSVRFSGLGDQIDAEGISDTNLRNSAGFTIEFRIYPKAFPAPSGDAHLFHLWQDHNSSIEWSIYYRTDLAPVPLFYAGPHALLTATDWNTYITTNTWHQIKITVAPDSTNFKTTLFIDGQTRGSYSGPQNFTSGDWALTFGDFIGDIDEVRISKGIVP